MSSSMIDLDELTLRCRSANAREYIAEAVACYKGGAYRATIVATWIAVVFDVLDKFRELELSGDKNAQAKLEAIDSARNEAERSGNWKKSLDIERTILDVAMNEFELLAPAEFAELLRLRDDRNRCAHPSMLSVDEPYEPSAELARYHVRNAVVFLLSHPPVQGKAALARILRDIESDFFPTDPKKARDRLAPGPLARAREPLVRSLIVVIVKQLLLENVLVDARRRKLAALAAIMEMYRAIGEATLSENIPKIAQRVDDEHWRRVIWFVGGLPKSWDYLTPDLQMKARQFVEEVEGDDTVPLVVSSAMQIPALASIAGDRASNLSTDDLSALLQINPSPGVLDAAIRHFAKSDSFNSSRTLARRLLIPAAPMLSEIQVREALLAYATNRQIYDSSGMPTTFLAFLDATADRANGAVKEWEAVYNRLSSMDLDSNGERLQKRIASEVLLLPEAEATN